MIVKNESAVIGRCLESVKGVADEVIVVDTGSDDDTVALAESMGVRVVHDPWRDDFAWSRNRSIEHARGQWILWLDADDELAPGCAETIRALKHKPPVTAWAFLVRNEKPGNTGSEFLQVRMFPHHPQIQFERRIHEQVMPSAARLGVEAQSVDAVIIHHGYSDPAAMKRKARRNIELLLRECDEDDPDPVMGIEIGDSYSILEEHEAALRWYCRVGEREMLDGVMPQVVSQARYGAGSMLVKLERGGEAVPHLQRSLELTPDRGDALYTLAVAHEMNGDSTRAIEMLERMLARTHHPALLVAVDEREATLKGFLRLARLCAAGGECERALQAVPTLSPQLRERPEVFNALGALYCRQGRLMEGLQQFEQSLAARCAGNAWAYVGLCIIYLRAGRRDVAAATMNTMRQVFGDHPAFLAFRELLDGDTGGHFAPGGDVAHRAEIDKEKEVLAALYGALR